MNETHKKLLLFNEKQREITETNITTISNNELIEKIQHYHNKCVEWQTNIMIQLKETK